jgi:hypothetical protein
MHPYAVALLLIYPVTGLAADDANSILQRMIEAEKQNDEKAGQYTYVEQSDRFGYEKAGQLKKDSSVTNEVIFVEGLPYKKLVARNDKPLVAREQTKEEARLRQTAEQRRKERRSGLLHRTVSVGSEAEILTLFDNRLLGEEEVRGRRTWVVECTPQAGRKPANNHEKEVLSWRKKYWIDQAENVPVGTLYTVVGDRIFLKPGSTWAIEFGKINDDAWLPVSSVFDFNMQFAVVVKGRGRTEYHNSKFQKFDVQSTITMDAPK